jgi:hypothetical protein
MTVNYCKLKCVVPAIAAAVPGGGTCYTAVNLVDVIVNPVN